MPANMITLKTCFRLLLALCVFASLAQAQFYTGGNKALPKLGKRGFYTSGHNALPKLGKRGFYTSGHNSLPKLGKRDPGAELDNQKMSDFDQADESPLLDDHRVATRTAYNMLRFPNWRPSNGLFRGAKYGDGMGNGDRTSRRKREGKM